MKKNTILTSISAFVFAVLVILIWLLFLGKNPIEFITILFTAFFNDKNGILISGFFLKISPLIFAAISVAFAFRTGLFNIGAEGQLSMGVFGAVVVGVIPGIPPFIHLPLVILSSFLFGAFWGFIPGMLKAVFKVHEVVITIMLNYIALYLLKDALLPIYADPSKSLTQTYPISENVLLKGLSTTKIIGVPLNSILFFLIALLAVGIFAFIINKTKFGFELRAGGLNRDAAEYAGIKSQRNIMLSMAIAGGFAGIGGAMYVVTLGSVATGGFSGTNIGFDGLAAALLGSSTPIGVLIGSGVLTYLSVVSLEIQQVLSVPKEITEMIVALILFFIAMSYMFDVMWSKIFGKFEKKDEDKPTEKNLEVEENA